MSAITVYYSGQYGSSSSSTISPDSVNLINLDGTNHSRTITRSGDELSNIIDGNTSTSSYITSSGTTSGHGPFVLEFGVPTSAIGNTLSKIRFKGVFLRG